MNQVLYKILSIAVLFCGEFLAIYAELYAARAYADQNRLASGFAIKAAIIATVAGFFLVTGYLTGYKLFKNIWVVSVISVTSILILEPIMNVTMFHQTPTKGAAVGFVLGVLGLIAAML